MTDKAKEQEPFERREELDNLYAEGHLVDEVYEMKFKGKSVHGLSAEGYFEIARTLGISVVSCVLVEVRPEVKMSTVLSEAEKWHKKYATDPMDPGLKQELFKFLSQLTDSMMFNPPPEYVAFHACAQNVDTGLMAWGYAQEAVKDGNGRANPYAGAMAATKSSRNAIQKLVPLGIAQKFIDEWIERGKKPKPQGIPPHAKVGGQQQTKPADPPKPPPVETKQEDAPDAERTEKVSALMDLFREHREPLNNIGVDAKSFWDGVREQYRVESRDQLTIPQIDALTKILNTPDYPAEWIQERVILF